jgi:hypothetical protein
MQPRHSLYLFLFAIGTILGTLPGAVSVRAADVAPKAAWDWTGIIGTGQSLAVGEKGRPVRLNRQRYSNLKLCRGRWMRTTRTSRWCR